MKNRPQRNKDGISKTSLLQKCIIHPSRGSTDTNRCFFFTPHQDDPWKYSAPHFYVSALINQCALWFWTSSLRASVHEVVFLLHAPAVPESSRPDREGFLLRWCRSGPQNEDVAVSSPAVPSLCWCPHIFKKDFKSLIKVVFSLHSPQYSNFTALHVFIFAWLVQVMALKICQKSLGGFWKLIFQPGSFSGFLPGLSGTTVGRRTAELWENFFSTDTGTFEMCVCVCVSCQQ